METQLASKPTRDFGIAVSPHTWAGIGVTALAILAMAVDHLMGDDPGLEDPPTFLIASGLSLTFALFLFGRVVPKAKAAAAPTEKAARVGLISSVLAVFPGIATAWLGLPFVLAGAGLALGLSARRQQPSGRATAAIVIGGALLLTLTCAYGVQAVGKLA